MSTSLKIEQEATYTMTGREAAQALMWAYDVERTEGERCVMNLIGAPGNAKTSIVQQFTEKLRKVREDQQLGTTALYSLRLNQADPTDLKGVPCFIEVDGKQMCTFASPEVFPLVGCPTSGKADFVVIHLDEMPQAPKSMQNLAANIIDGVIGDNTLDFSRTLIITSGNRKQDNAATYDTPSNVKTRLTTININLTYDEWRTWGIETQKISGVVLGFLENYHGTYFQHPNPPADLVTYHNPRTWHKVSSFIKAWPGTLTEWAKSPLTPSIVSGTIGAGAAGPFLEFCKTLDSLNIESVCAGHSPAAPSSEKMDVWYMACGEFAFRISKMGSYLEKIVEQKKVEPNASMLTEEDRKVLKNIGDWMLKAYKDGNADVAFITLVHRLQSKAAINTIRKITNTTEEFKSWRELINILASTANTRTG